MIKATIFQEIGIVTSNDGKECHVSCGALWGGVMGLQCIRFGNQKIEDGLRLPECVRAQKRADTLMALEATHESM